MKDFLLYFFVRLVVIQNFALISAFSTAALLYIKPVCLGVCALFSHTFQYTLFQRNSFEYVSKFMDSDSSVLLVHRCLECLASSIEVILPLIWENH